MSKKKIKKSIDVGDGIRLWLPRIKEACQKLQELEPNAKWLLVEKSGRQDKYSASGLVEKIESLCSEITNSYFILIEQITKSGEGDRLTGAAGHHLTVIHLAMEGLINRLQYSVEELERGSRNYFPSYVLNNCCMNMHAISTVSDLAVSNIGRLVGSEKGGDKSKPAVGESRIDEAMKIWKSLDPKQDRAERVRQLRDRMNIKDRTARHYAKLCEQRLILEQSLNCAPSTSA